MPVPMMDVREVSVAVVQRRMGMGMAMRFLPVPRQIVDMLVMLFVRVRMAVHHRIVSVGVPMALAQVQPDAQAHQQRRHPERRRRRLTEQQDAQGGADERRGREIGAGA